MAALYSSVDALIATTLPIYASKVMGDNVFDKIPLLWWLMDRGRVEPAEGGSRIMEPVLLGSNSTVQMMNPYDTIDTTAQEGMKLAEYEWKQIGGSVVLSEADRIKNRGAAAVMSLIKAKTEQCEATIRDTLSTQIHANNDGTDKNLLGLNYMIDSLSTSTVGQLLATTYPTWVSYEAACATLTQAAINLMLDTITSQKGNTDLLVTGLTAFQALRSLIQPQQRFNDAKMADAGFKNILVGGVPCMLDGDTYTAGTNHMYALDSSALKLRPSTANGGDKAFIVEGPLQSTNQTMKIWLIYWFGALTCSARRHLGKLTGITG